MSRVVAPSPQSSFASRAARTVVLLVLVLISDSSVTAFAPAATTTAISATAPTLSQQQQQCSQPSKSERAWRASTLRSALADDKDIDTDILDATSASRGRVDRRTALFAVAAAAAAVALPPKPAYALKKRNEALCGTGFFEHIYEYKCTEIGDIEDEGYSKSLSTEENGLTEGLLGKLDVGSGDPFQVDTSNRGKATAKGVSYDPKKTPPKDRSSISNNNNK